MVRLPWIDETVPVCRHAIYCTLCPFAVALSQCACNCATRSPMALAIAPLLEFVIVLVILWGDAERQASEAVAHTPAPLGASSPTSPGRPPPTPPWRLFSRHHKLHQLHRRNIEQRGFHGVCSRHSAALMENCRAVSSNQGRGIKYRSSGWSMWPQIHGNDECSYEPVKRDKEVEQDDIVFCQVQPSNQYYAHKVLWKEYDDQKQKWYYEIGNMRVRSNGWCNIEHIYCRPMADVQCITSTVVSSASDIEAVSARRNITPILSQFKASTRAVRPGP